MAVLSGIDKTKARWDLEDGTYWAVMGGIELDLNKANMEPGREYHLSCYAIMGGIEITVPENATVYSQGSVILGGLDMLDDETGGIFSTLKAEQHSSQTDAPVIQINSRAALGGVEIKSR